MGRHAQLVVGPAGSGKSTYCHMVQQHCAAKERTCRVINLDPAADAFRYTVSVDVRDLISVENAMEEQDLGPNGALVFCMEYLMENMDWLEEQIEAAGGTDDEYFIFDCPGQIELFTHIPVIKHVCTSLQQWGYNTCAVYLIDALFVDSPYKYLSGVMIALSTMVNLEVPHINVLSKCDLADESIVEQYLLPDTFMLRSIIDRMLPDTEAAQKKYKRLNNAFCDLLETYSMVRFIPLNPNDDDSVDICLAHVDNAIQYGEDVEPRDPDALVEEA